MYSNNRLHDNGLCDHWFKLLNKKPEKVTGDTYDGKEPRSNSLLTLPTFIANFSMAIFDAE